MAKKRTRDESTTTKVAPKAAPVSLEKEKPKEDEFVTFDNFDKSEDDNEDLDGDDSSDEEDREPENGPKFEKDQLPKVKSLAALNALEKSKAATKQTEKKKKPENKVGVIYLGRIPRGFYENEMREYFEQFGEVQHVRLSRSRETGASRGFAFIQFAHKSVAQIVAETMNNYLLCGRILQCQVIDKPHRNLWKGEGELRKNARDVLRRREVAKREKDHTAEQKSAIAHRLLARESKKRDQLKELGIDYEFPGFKDAKAPKPVEVVAEEPKKGKEKKKNGRKSLDNVVKGNDKVVKEATPSKKPKTQKEEKNVVSEEKPAKKAKLDSAKGNETPRKEHIQTAPSSEKPMEKSKSKSKSRKSL